MGRSHLTLQFRNSPHEPASHDSVGTGSILARSSEGKGKRIRIMSVPRHSATDTCLQSCTPAQILCMVLVTPSTSMAFFLWGKCSSFSPWELLLIACWCCIFMMMKYFVFAKRWLCGIHMQTQQWLRAPVYFNSQLEGNKTFYSQGTVNWVQLLQQKTAGKTQQSPSCERRSRV